MRSGTFTKVALAVIFWIAAPAILLVLFRVPESGHLILVQTFALVLLAAGCIGYEKMVVTGRVPGLATLRRLTTERAWERRKRAEHEERVADLIEECRPPPFEPAEKERAYVLGSLRPGVVLLNLSASRPAYEKHFKDGRIVHEIYFDRTGNSPSRAERAKLEADKIARREWLEADPEFREAVARLARAGVSYEFGGQGDACGEFAVLRLRGDAKALQTLERMAADDAGFTGRAERAKAAERFRIYMLRNYGDEWQLNREIYPDVGGSPYSAPQYWSKST